MPSPPPGLFFEAATKNELHRFSEEWHTQLGGLFREDDIGGGAQAIFIGCPQIVKELFRQEERHPVHIVPEPWKIYLKKHQKKRGLFFLDGEEWWKARQKMNPMFLKSQSMEQIVNEEVNKVVGNWEAGTVFDLDKQLNSWTIATTLLYLFGNDIHTKKPLGNVIDRIAESVQQIFLTTSKLKHVDPYMAEAEGIDNWVDFETAFERAMKEISLLAGDILKQNGRESIAGRMLQSDDNVEEVNRLVVDLVLAAAETTSTTALWLLHVLAEDKDLQLRVRENHQISRGLLREVFRLYPVAPFLTRITQNPIRLGEYNISAGTVLLVSTYFMGRNETIFPNPLQVSPERWLRGAERQELSSAMAYSVLPFGHGVRGCIGRRLAELQLTSLVERVCQQWTLATNEKQQSIEYSMRTIGVPNSEVLIDLGRQKVLL